MIEKNNSSGGYATLLDLIQDMRLLRSNCYRYNANPDSTDVRVMVDVVIDIVIAAARRVMQEAIEWNDESKIALAFGVAQIQHTDLIDNKYSWRDADSLLRDSEPPMITQWISQNPLPPPPLAVTQAPQQAIASFQSKKKQATGQEAVRVEDDEEYVDDGNEDITYAKDDEYDHDEDFTEDFDSSRKSSSKLSVKYENKTGKSRVKEAKPSKSKAPRSKRDVDDYDDEDYDGVSGGGAWTEVAPQSQSYYQHELPEEWQKCCDRVMKRLAKHEYIKVADFYSPVVVQFPNIAKDYLSVIKEPMDLALVSRKLYEGRYSNQHEWFRDTCLVFENASFYNDGHEEITEDFLVMKCEHLKRLTQWYALEMTDLEDGADFLSVENQEKEREERRTMLREGTVQLFPEECPKVLKKLESSMKNKQELEYFKYDPSLSIPGYTDIIETPMDYNLVREQLIKGSYQNFISFLDDLKLIFDNAKRYNGLFLDSDTTGVSLKVFTAAEKFSDILELHVYREFSIDMCDKLKKLSISKEYLQRVRREQDLPDLDDAELVKQSMKKGTKKNSAYMDNSFVSGIELDDDNEREKYDGEDDDDVFEEEEEVDPEEDMLNVEEYAEDDDDGEFTSDGVPRIGRTGVRKGGSSGSRRHVAFRGNDVGLPYGHGFGDQNEEETEDYLESKLKESVEEIKNSDHGLKFTQLSINIKTQIFDDTNEKLRKKDKRKVRNRSWARWTAFAVTTFESERMLVDENVHQDVVEDSR